MFLFDTRKGTNKVSYRQHLNYQKINIFVFSCFIDNFARKFIMQHIGKTIKGIREEKGLTQQQIAGLIHMCVFRRN